jgi:hypothetical protein
MAVLHFWHSSEYRAYTYMKNKGTAENDDNAIYLLECLPTAKASNAQALNLIIMSRVWRLYKTGIGLTTGFIKHSYNTCLHFTVTHTIVFLVSVRFHLLSPINVVASSAPLFLGSGPLDWSSHDDWSLTQLTDFGSSFATSYIARERGCSVASRGVCRAARIRCPATVTSSS